MRRQPAEALADLDVTPEEPVGVVDIERNETSVRALGAGHVGYSVGDEDRILAKDRLLQGEQVRPGIDAQLSGQHRARLAQGPQGFTLTAGLVLGQGEQRPAPLAQWLAGDECLSLGQHLPVPATLHTSIDAQLLGIETGLLEPHSLDLRRFPAFGVGKRLAARHNASASPNTYAARSVSPRVSS